MRQALKAEKELVCLDNRRFFFLVVFCVDAFFPPLHIYFTGKKVGKGEKEDDIRMGKNRKVDKQAA